MNNWIALSIVVLTVLVVMWLDKQEGKVLKTVLNWFPPILFAYVIPASFTHVFKLDLGNVFLHSISKDWIIPLAILAVMSALSFSQLRMVGFRPILLFVIGSLVIAVLPVLLVMGSGLINQNYQQLFVDQEYWKGLVPIVGGWIGGSTSQLVLKEIINTPESLFLSILVLDNILVNIWTILMFQFIKKTDSFNKIFSIKDAMPYLGGVDNEQGQVNSNKARLLTTVSVILVVLLTNLLTSSFLWKIITLSILGLLLGNVLKFWDHRLVLKVGGVLIILIMAILGLKLNFENLILPTVLVVLVIVWLLLHFVFMLIVARLLKLNLAWVPIASMANLGGISTAPAVTAAYKKELMPHAILLAILSMVTGTAWGMFTIYLFGGL